MNYSMQLSVLICFSSVIGVLSSLRCLQDGECTSCPVGTTGACHKSHCHCYHGKVPQDCTDDTDCTNCPQGSFGHCTNHGKCHCKHIHDPVKRFLLRDKCMDSSDCIRHKCTFGKISYCQNHYCLCP